MISPQRASELVRAFGERRLLVVGDVILDRYVWGRVERISPEAPVPVVQVTRESVMPGGAGNVARNLAALTARVELVALVGEDETGRELEKLLSDWKIDGRGLVAEPGRPTTVKTRVIARAQQVVRFDRELEEPLSPTAADRLVETVRERAPSVEGVILQDYGKGVLVPAILKALMSTCTEAGLPVFVDPKAEHWECYRGAELIKPNLREAEAVTGIRVRTDEDLARLGRGVLERTAARTVAITRGEGGISLFYAGGESDEVPTRPRAVSDATGAGDTAIATLALARLAGASWVEAAALANAAAGVVVGVPGTAAVTPDELLYALDPGSRSGRGA
jgi:D-beta-D-heptose 7-phosphate kinase/D-beta-D-heptose 1-phosphate adenosyltransferase